VFVRTKHQRSPEGQQRARVVQLRLVHVDPERRVGAVVVQDSCFGVKAREADRSRYEAGQRAEVSGEGGAVVW